MGEGVLSLSSLSLQAKLLQQGHPDEVEVHSA